MIEPHLTKLHLSHLMRSILLFHIKLLERILLKQTESNNFLYICLSPWWWCDNWAAFAKVAHKPFAILTNKCDIDTEVLTAKIPQQTQSICLVYICISKEFSMQNLYIL